MSKKFFQDQFPQKYDAGPGSTSRTLDQQSTKYATGTCKCVPKHYLPLSTSWLGSNCSFSHCGHLISASFEKISDCNESLEVIGRFFTQSYWLFVVAYIRMKGNELVPILNSS